MSEIVKQDETQSQLKESLEIVLAELDKCQEILFDRIGNNGQENLINLFEAANVEKFNRLSQGKYNKELETKLNAYDISIRNLRQIETINLPRYGKLIRIHKELSKTTYSWDYSPYQLFVQVHLQIIFSQLIHP